MTIHVEREDYGASNFNYINLKVSKKGGVQHPAILSLIIYRRTVAMREHARCLLRYFTWRTSGLCFHASLSGITKKARIATSWFSCCARCRGYCTDLRRYWHGASRHGQNITKWRWTTGRTRKGEGVEKAASKETKVIRESPARLLLLPRHLLKRVQNHLAVILFGLTQQTAKLVKKFRVFA
jgi:hypothetical protein